MAVKEIPFFDLKRQIASIRGELLSELTAVVDSSQFILGPKVNELEAKIAELVGVKHAIALASGTDALLLSLIALGVGDGDAVITTPVTFFATASSIARAGATPIFVDVDRASMNMSPAKTRELIEKDCEKTPSGLRHKKTGKIVKGMIPVHIFGLMADMPEFKKIASQYGLFVLEDAAQALGSWEKIDGARAMAGSLGDSAAFSFYPTKNLGAFGDAGMATTNRDDVAEKIKLLRVHGSPARDRFTIIGHLSRMDAMQATVLLVKLPRLGAYNERRAKIADSYRDAIRSKKWASEMTVPDAMGKGHIYHQFVLRTARRDDLVAHLKKNGLGVESYYSTPIHLQPAFAHLGYKPGDLPEAEKIGRESVALPIWPELEDSEIGGIVKQLDDFFK